MDKLDLTRSVNESVREKLEPRGLVEEASGGRAGGPLMYSSGALFGFHKLRREDEELSKMLVERQQKLEQLQQRKAEFHAAINKVKDLHLSLDTVLKVDEANQLVKKAEKERKERLRLDVELARLELVRGEEVERKRERERRIQRDSVYKEFMERAGRISKFDNVQEFTAHVENLLHVRDLFQSREKKAYEQVDQLEKSLLTLQGNQRMLRLQKNIRLSELQTEIEKTRSEALHWESRWNHIQETAAQQTLLLGRIKMATLNLYEITEDGAEGDEDVDKNDTEKQLEKIMTFIQDHEDILKQHQDPSQNRDGQQEDMSKLKRRRRRRSKKHNAMQNA